MKKRGCLDKLAHDSAAQFVSEHRRQRVLALLYLMLALGDAHISPEMQSPLPPDPKGYNYPAAFGSRVESN